MKPNVLIIWRTSVAWVSGEVSKGITTIVHNLAQAWTVTLSQETFLPLYLHQTFYLHITTDTPFCLPAQLMISFLEEMEATKQEPPPFPWPSLWPPHVCTFSFQFLLTEYKLYLLFLSSGVFVCICEWVWVPVWEWGCPCTWRPEESDVFSIPLPVSLRLCLFTNLGFVLARLEARRCYGVCEPWEKT